MTTLKKKKPTLLQALIPIVFMIVALAIGYGVLGINAEPIMIASAFIAGIIAVSYTHLHFFRDGFCARSTFCDFTGCIFPINRKTNI